MIFFMNVPVQPDGTMGIVDGRSKPGDYVELRAESRVLAVVSNCPQTHNPCNGFNPTPIRVMVVRHLAMRASSSETPTV
jgi:uncharacterized protein